MEPNQDVIYEIEKKIKDSTATLHKLGPMLGHAEQIVEFSSDQRKNALAAEQKRFIERGESVAGSETLARSSPVYLEAIKELAATYEEAQAIRYKWRATMCSYEAARSLLARQRETLHTFNE